MKTLASCTPLEFARQTVLIKNHVAKWLTDTDISNIRKRMTLVDSLPQDATDEQKADARRRQVKANFSAMFDAVFAEHPEETIKILALVCFIPVENVNDHTMSEYFAALTELINDDAVIGFFTSLLKWAQTPIFRR